MLLSCRGKGKMGTKKFMIQGACDLCGSRSTRLMKSRRILGWSDASNRTSACHVTRPGHCEDSNRYPGWLEVRLARPYDVAVWLSVSLLLAGCNTCLIFFIYFFHSASWSGPKGWLTAEWYSTGLTRSSRLRKRSRQWMRSWQTNQSDHWFLAMDLALSTYIPCTVL